ncbi:MAG: hypothetical protein ACJAS4_001571 [Bacteriovoracaceae bacterium]|jgi:hypothetical protein
MKHFVLFLLLFSSHVKAQLSGTEPREENEYKISFELEEPSINSLTEKIQRSLFDLLNSEKLITDKKLSSEYYLTGKLIPYCYLDFYLDSPDFQLYKNNKIYRLRYRWKSDKQFDDFSKNLKQKDYPIRAEIQAKTQIKISNLGYVSSFESRFEFRNDSVPFSVINPAPTSPWPVKDFLKYAKNGTYKNYQLIPSFEIRKNLDVQIQLEPKITIKTLRRRFHLNLKNRWGNGPNPNQAFIITIDTFAYLKFDNISRAYIDDYSKPFYEIEIEFERNTSTMLALDSSSSAKNAKSFFKRDHKMIRENILNTLIKNSVKLSSEISSKYKKVIIHSGLIGKDR